MLKVLDLFSGLGGFSLGLERAGGFTTSAFCEIEPFCQKILARHWPGVPIHDDVTKLRGLDVGPTDVVTAGYPCQPFSLAGKRGGQDDNRHLWPEVARLIRELKPTWFIGENVTGHITMGLDEVLSDLEGLGYTWEAFVIPACAIGADHRRDRVWIAANINGEGLQERQVQPGVASKEDGEDWWQASALHAWREPPSGMVRTADGVSGRVDRIRALGNAVVPQIPELIGRAILEANK